MKAKAIALLMMVGLAVAPASAQSTQPMKFRTPFAFMVGDQLLPAGACTVHVVSVTGTLLVRRADGPPASNFAGSIPLQKPDYETKYRLVFHRYGTQYYLSEIWTPGYRTGRAIIQHPSELKLAKAAEPQHVTLYVESPGR
jgi:hypothetical protein